MSCHDHAYLGVDPAIRMALASYICDGCGGGAPVAAAEVSGAAAGDLTSFEERAGGEGSLGSLDPPLHPLHHFFLARLLLRKQPKDWLLFLQNMRPGRGFGLQGSSCKLSCWLH